MRAKYQFHFSVGLHSRKNPLTHFWSEAGCGRDEKNHLHVSTMLKIYIFTSRYVTEKVYVFQYCLFLYPILKSRQFFFVLWIKRQDKINFFVISRLLVLRILPTSCKYFVTYLKFWDIVLKTNICVPSYYSLSTTKFKTVIIVQSFQVKISKLFWRLLGKISTKIFYSLHILFRFTILET